MINFFDHRYPYSDVHELNLDWIISNMQKTLAQIEAFTAANSLTFADPILWDISQQYSKNTIVLSSTGDAFLSLEIVPEGIQLDNTKYWLEIFNFADYVRTANSNLSVNIEQNTTRSTHAYSVDDWLLYNDVLYKVTAAIAVDDLLVVGTNITHFTVEDFCRTWSTYMVNTISQYKNDIDASELAYKNDIDASELAYKNQLDQSVANTVSSLQTQLNAAISGATVDSEVINARVGFDNTTYATLGEAIRKQISSLVNGGLNNKVVNAKSLDIYDEPVNLWNPDDWESGFLSNYHTISSGSQRTSGYIPVDDGDVIQVGYVFPAGSPSADHQAIFTWAFYDENLVGTHMYTARNNTSITAQTGDKYCRISLNAAYFGANVIVYKNLTDMPSYVPFKLQIKSKYLPSANIGNLLIVNHNDANAYQSIYSAVVASSTGDVIVVFPGTYDEVINVAKDFTLIGLDREKCILQSTSPEYANTPLYVSKNVTIKNMTVKMNAAAPSQTRNGYALHIDKIGAGVLTFENCTFYNNVGAALGAGGQQDQYSYFNNCTFISDVAEIDGTAESGYDTYGAVFFHAPVESGVTGCGAQFKDCVFNSSLLKVIRLSSIQDQSDMELTFINCNVYSKYNKHSNVVQWNAHTHLTISDLSYGNSTSELN